MSEEWTTFRADGSEASLDTPLNLPPTPPWRAFAGSAGRGRAAAWVPPAGEDVVKKINAAVWLRRPVLVSGLPGTGKSSLAWAVARELGLGEVLVWNINSRTTVDDGLYRYDAIGRLHDHSLRRGFWRRDTDIGRYVRLGPLGTALLPGNRPRVLLIDELDKADIDLPDDLLTVFEDGRYEIPELRRLAARQHKVEVLTADTDKETTATIVGGHVQCNAYPIMLLTSNGDREFSPAFLRRCIRLRLPPPLPAELETIVRSWLRVGLDADLLQMFQEARVEGHLATDQLLNALYLRMNDVQEQRWSPGELKEAVLKALDGTA